MFRRYFSIAIFVSYAFSVFAASPKIEFNTTNFDCGPILEGKQDKLQASFTIKNTGDATLVLSSVRPGCGCTVVKYDSLIQPGKSSIMKSTVNIANYPVGAISKNIAVTSNAVNTPMQQLTISATVLPIIDVSEQVITLDASKQGVAHTLFLSCLKKDLKLLSMEFNQAAPVGEVMQNTMSAALTYTLSPTDSIRADKYKVYKLGIFPPQAQQAMSGTITIKTNHPDKAELVLKTAISK
jgi:hypothetical protein